MLFVEDAVTIAHVRVPTHRLSGGRINRQSNLSTTLEFGFVFLKVGQFVIVDCSRILLASATFRAAS